MSEDLSAYREIWEEMRIRCSHEPSKLHEIIWLAACEYKNKQHHETINAQIETIKNLESDLFKVNEALAKLNNEG